MNHPVARQQGIAWFKNYKTMNKQTIIIISVVVLVFAAIVALQVFTSYKIWNPEKQPSQNENSASEENSSSPPSAAKVLNIFIRDYKFQPNFNAVPVGTEVTWINEGEVSHIVTLDDWDSGEIPPGGKFSKTFDTPGKYQYKCSLHPQMKGEIIVGQQ